MLKNAKKTCVIVKKNAFCCDISILDFSTKLNKKIKKSVTVYSTVTDFAKFRG